MTTSQDNLPSEEPMGTSEEEDNETQQSNQYADEEEEPEELKWSPNTKCLRVKAGTQTYMKAHSDDFAVRELLWCYDT